jgi:hypothetical protein
MTFHCFRDDVPSHKIKRGNVGGIKEKLFFIHSEKALNNSKYQLHILFVILHVGNDTCSTANIRLYTVKLIVFKNYPMLEISPPYMFKIKLKHHVMARGSAHILRYGKHLLSWVV